MSRRTGKILMIDDEVDLLQLSGSILSLEGHAVQSSTTAEEGLRLLDREVFDVVLLDLRLPGMSGLEFLEALQPRRRREEVIVLTAYAAVESAVQAMRAGAYGYVAKPFDADVILAEIDKILELQELRAENQALRGQPRRGSECLIGDHQAMRLLRERIREVGPSAVAVLIRGETGTGKELVAEAIHATSDRADQPLIKCNCAAFSQGLLENELFGHVKGAFTGATEDRKGRFEEADGGSLFLDEIGDLGPETQIRLLRVLQEQEFEPVGSTETRRVDVRLITATHQDLEAQVCSGRFREDLLYRVKGLTLGVPALRERRSDIPLLCAHFLERYRAPLQHGLAQINPEALAILEAHAWPGNVRELENVLKGAMVLARGDELASEHVLALLELPEGEGDRGGDSWLHAVASLQFHPARAEFETLFIRRALRAAGGNLSQAAQTMALARRTLQRKVQEYEIDVDGLRAGS